MKKIVLIILSFVYLTASVGATVNMHYCMGKLVDFSFFDDHQEDCSKCGMKKVETEKNNCCKDEHKQLKVDDDQKVADTYFHKHLVNVSSLPVHFYELPAAIVFDSIIATPFSHAPPLISKESIYLLNCNFRI